MGRLYESMTDDIQTFIKEQKIFFVGTATDDSRVNVSPKGMDSFRVINASKVVWMNLTGSGNETAAHLLENDRMTIMFCAFEGNPVILRLYGHAKAHHPRDEKWTDIAKLFPPSIGARQYIEMDIDLVQTSCGMSVPLMDYREDRQQLAQWAEKKGEEGIRIYWEEKNAVSLDGKETKILG